MKNKFILKISRNFLWSFGFGFLATFIVFIIFMTEVLEGKNETFDLKDSFFIKTYFISVLLTFLYKLFLSYRRKDSIK